MDVRLHTRLYHCCKQVEMDYMLDHQLHVENTSHILVSFAWRYALKAPQFERQGIPHT